MLAGQLHGSASNARRASSVTSAQVWRGRGAQGPLWQDAVSEFEVISKPNTNSRKDSGHDVTPLDFQQNDELHDGSLVWSQLTGWAADDENEEENEEGEEEEDVEQVDNGDGGREAVAAATELETEEQSRVRSRLTGQQPLERYMGPVVIAPTGVSGRGVVTTARVEAGELLMVAVPYLGPVLFCGGPGATPENEELAQHLMRSARLGAKQHALLAQLDHAEAEDVGQLQGLAATRSDSGTRRAGRRPAVLASASRGGLVPTMDELRAAAEEGAGTATSIQAADRPAAPLLPIRLPMARLESIVNRNCMGEEFQDLAASALSGPDRPPLGHLGLWPEPSFLNHSCAPTATAYTIGDRLLVQATEAHEAGQEVTVSYLGAALTAPLAQRRALLVEQYDFKCCCRRCVLEQRVAGQPLQHRIAAVRARCQAIGPVLESCIGAGRQAACHQLRKELLGLRDEVEAALRSVKAALSLSSREACWLQASVYDLYDLISLASDELTDTSAPAHTSSDGGATHLETEWLGVCARLLEAVAPGSDSHCALAAELAERAAVRWGVDDGMAQQASSICEKAFRARYGRQASPLLLQQLVAARLVADN